MCKPFFDRKISGLTLVSLIVFSGWASSQEVASPEKITATQNLAVETERALVPVGDSLDQLGLALRARSFNEKADLAVAASRTQTCPASRLPQTLTRSQQQELKSLQSQVIDVLRSGSQSKFEQVASGVADLALATGDISVVCGVMYRAIGPAEARTFELAQSLQRNLDAKRYLREAINEIRDVIANNIWPTKVTYVDGAGVERTITLLSNEEAVNLLKNLEEQFQTAGDMTQMLQMRLQDAMNELSQMMTLLSAIMKNQHETLKQIIRNMKG